MYFLSPTQSILKLIWIWVNLHYKKNKLKQTLKNRFNYYNYIGYTDLIIIASVPVTTATGEKLFLTPRRL